MRDSKHTQKRKQTNRYVNESFKLSTLALACVFFDIFSFVAVKVYVSSLTRIFKIYKIRDEDDDQNCKQ